MFFFVFFFFFESTEIRTDVGLHLFGIGAHTATTSAAVLRSSALAWRIEQSEQPLQGCKQDRLLLSGKQVRTQLFENPLKGHTDENLKAS